MYEFIYPHRIFVAAGERAEREITEKSLRDSAKLRRIASRPVVSSEEKKEERDRKRDEAKEYKKDLSRQKKKAEMPDNSYSFAKDRENEKLTAASVNKTTGTTDVPITDEERKLLDAMGSVAVTPDELMEKGFSASDIMSSLTVLEILGFVTSVPGGRYVRIKK